jgi:chlorite dismutase
MAAAMRRTGMGSYLQTPYSHLAMTKTSIYVDDHVHEGQEGTRNKIVIGGGKYLFVYPFVKTRAWYVLPKEERQDIMREHIRFGHEFPSVKLNTTYSFGLDDQDFVVAFETNRPADFVDLVQGLRETQSSLYTQRDTPIFTCTQQDVPTILAHISGV